MNDWVFISNSWRYLLLPPWYSRTMMCVDTLLIMCILKILFNDIRLGTFSLVRRLFTCSSVVKNNILTPDGGIYWSR